jgi:RHS repeat-associated protein
MAMQFRTRKMKGSPSVEGGRMKVQRFIGLCSFILLALLPLRAQDLNSAVRVSQSRTLLPDGRILLLGGFENTNTHNLPVSNAYLVSTSGVERLSAGLRIARAGHTATVLPDGTVLIFGGVGTNRQIVSAAELFDPATRTFSTLTDVVAVPRAFHTATLLIDGTVLLAGGIEAGGEFPDDVQLWDWRTHTALSQHALLMMPREDHTAVLLSDGSVRVSGGTDRFGHGVLVDEMYDPDTKRFRFANQGEMGQDPDGDPVLKIATSIPGDGDTAVSIQSMIALRFTRRLDVTTVTAGDFALFGPNDAAVAAKVTAAENGRLAFVVPNAPLKTGTMYVLRIRNATDSQNNALGPLSISFTTEGEPNEGLGSEDSPGQAATTQFQQLPPLGAGSGETALAGQVLKLNGWPLEHVTLEIDGKKVQSDDTGRFLMKGLAAGHHVLWIDASTANRADAKYGTYEVGVTVLAGKTNVLNYTIWMTKLDTAHAVTIASPTTRETVITNPNLPGLELRIPASTVITDRYGKVVRQVSITPVPLDKPPFPLPAGVSVPLYFTIQPGGAYLKVLNPGNGPKGARLIYPNSRNLRPGTLVNFWNYNADAKGWYIYGNGAVAPDGKSVVPDPGVVIYEFTGAMEAGGDGTLQGCLAGTACRPGAADPVSLSTGMFVYSKTDLALPDTIPISLSRTYLANDSFSRSFGVATTLSYDMYLIGDIFPYTFQELILNDGARVRFDRISPGTSYVDAVYAHVSAQDPFYGARLSWNGTLTVGNWKLVLQDGTTYTFPEASASTNPRCQAPTQITDRHGNTVQLQRAATSNSQTGCQLLKVVSPNGRFISLTHDTQGRITQAQDNSGRTVSYAYDTAGRLSTVTDVASGVTTYTYSDQNQMLTIQDARGIVYLTNQYDSSGRVVQQTQADGGTFLFKWTPTASTTQDHFWLTTGGGGGGGGAVVNLLNSGCWGPNGYTRSDSQCQVGYLPLVQQVDVTDPRGYVRRVTFGPTGYTTSDTHALSQPEQQAVTYQYYSDNLAQSVTDALNRTTSFNYDANGNVTSVTQLAGTSNAVTSTFAYGGPFGQISSATDPLGHSSTFTYDQLGNLTTATDPLGHQTTLTYDGAGRPVSVQDALSNAAHFAYFGGDLVTVTDPLGNVSTQSVDSVGRVISAIDALGNTTKYQYNNLNLLTQVTDAQGHNTSFSYDGNGNLLNLTDPASHTTSYTYDNMDRTLTRSDPLNRQESFAYDANGNLASATDHKGQVTAFTYDGLNRTTLAGFGAVVSGGTTTYQSTIAYTYDAGNRMTQAVDSAGGTITEAYDGLDRMTSETTSLGTISYGYDAASRQTTMQVAGQPQVSYTYDNANRLTQIAQSTSTTGFSYDNANRRTSLTLPNGVSVSYSYDSGSQLTGITYQFGGSTLGNLSYSYDSLGHRTQAGGSFARTGLPGAVSSTTYDSANQLTNWNGTSISYDANGNMLSDGSNSFNWNTRDQVASLNGVSLQYDAFGRRTKNTSGTSVLYNGPNAIQELSGSTVIANLLSGGVDEVFTRTDSSGSFTPLKDALGSTIALVDSSGIVQTTYSYDPFGGTSVSGSGNANEFQYTGRENDGGGLYYYRARYYSPLLGRFINEDPLGFAGSGPNLYAYAEDDPIDFSDPFGLDAAAVVPVVREIGKGLRVVPTRYPRPNLFGTFKANLALLALSLEITAGEMEIEWAMALIKENQAGDETLHQIHLYNLAIAAHPEASSLGVRARILAGRYPSKGGGCDTTDWGVNRLIKELHDDGFVYTGPTNSGGGRMYQNPETGEEIRIMPRPCRPPFRRESRAKFENDWYYRYRSGPDQPWGGHQTIPNK